jgi:hypothetical protein
MQGWRLNMVSAQIKAAREGTVEPISSPLLTFANERKIVPRLPAMIIMVIFCTKKERSTFCMTACGAWKKQGTILSSSKFWSKREDQFLCRAEDTALLALNCTIQWDIDVAIPRLFEPMNCLGRVL